MSYTYKDNTKEVVSKLRKAIDRGLVAIGERAVYYAKKNETRVDTGYLRNSITYAISGEAPAIKEYKADKGGKTGSYSGTRPQESIKSVYLGTNVPYALAIEEGSRGKKPLHFLRRAATEHTEEYQKLMRESLENA